jgi:tyrosyl-tRNA synthetase
MFGKTMSIPDTLILDYFTLASDVSQAELGEIKRDVALQPYEMKRKLARAIVALYHGAEESARAEEEFVRRFKPAKGKEWTEQLPSEMPEASIRAEGPQVGILALLTETGLAASRSEARRLIEQGGVVVDGQKITDWNASIELSSPVVVKVGKLKFARVSRS